MRRFPRIPCCVALWIALSISLSAACAAQTLPGRVDDALPPIADAPLPLPTDPLLRDARKATDMLRGELGYALRARTLAREQRDRVALDPQGAAMLRHEFIAFDADPAALAAAQAAGFETVRREAFDALGESITVLHDRRGRAPARGLRALRVAMPSAEIAFHHLYLPAAAGESTTAVPSRGPAAASPPGTGTLRVGLIDGGVDGASPALARSRIVRRGCDGEMRPQAHGTIVASRLMNGLGGTLYAADLWCGDVVGRGTLGLIDALDWMTRERVPVVNISLVGPDNPLLRRVVRTMTARGHVLVAAVGNDGPAAPPRFPAAYPDVIGVGAVDAKLRALPESARGPQVDFCAPGIVDARLRGTSFAAPLVARLAALGRPSPSSGAAAEAHARLKAASRKAGRQERDPRCGEGIVAAHGSGS